MRGRDGKIGDKNEPTEAKRMGMLMHTAHTDM